MCDSLSSPFFNVNAEWSEPLSYDKLLGKTYDQATQVHLLDINPGLYQWLCEPLHTAPAGPAKLLAQTPIDILRLPAVAHDLQTFNVDDSSPTLNAQIALLRRQSEMLYRDRTNTDPKTLYWGLDYEPWAGDFTMAKVAGGWATLDQLQLPQAASASSSELLSDLLLEVPTTSQQPSLSPPSPLPTFSYDYDDHDDDDEEEGYDAEDLY